MKKTNLIFLILVIIIVLSIGVIYLLYPRAEETKPVRIGYLPIVASLPLYTAQENGYFEEQGINIEAIQIQTSNQIIEALIRGDIDIGIGLSSVPILAVESKDPGKIKVFSVSDLTTDRPFDYIITNKEEITSIKDLEGKKIGVFPGSTAKKFVKKYLQNAEINITNTKWVDITPPNQLPALYSGSIDALHSYEPITTIALENPKVKPLARGVYSEVFDHTPVGVSVVSSKFLKNNPNLAKDTVISFNNAFDFNREHIGESRKIAEVKFKLDPNVAEKFVIPYVVRSDEIDRTVFQKWANLLFEIEELEIKVDTSTLFYNP